MSFSTVLLKLSEGNSFHKVIFYYDHEVIQIFFFLNVQGDQKTVSGNLKKKNTLVR